MHVLRRFASQDDRPLRERLPRARCMGSGYSPERSRVRSGQVKGELRWPITIRRNRRDFPDLFQLPAVHLKRGYRRTAFVLIKKRLLAHTHPARVDARQDTTQFFAGPNGRMPVRGEPELRHGGAIQSRPEHGHTHTDGPTHSSPQTGVRAVRKGVTTARVQYSR